MAHNPPSQSLAPKFPIVEHERGPGRVQDRKNYFRGARLRGADLPFANFQNQDLRSADFRHANLYGANFSGADCGVSPARSIQLIGFALALSILVGVVSGWAGSVVEQWVSNGSTEEKLLVSLLSALWFSFVGMSWFWGVEHAAKRLFPAFSIVFAVLIVLVNVWGIGTGRGVFSVAFLFLSTSVLMLVGAFARALAGTRWQLAFLGVAVVGGYTGGAFGGGGFALAIAVAAAIIGQRMLHKPELYPLSLQTLGKLLAWFGTRFDDADLRSANFHGAHLHGVRFHGARLAEASFEDVETAKFQMDPRTIKSVSKTTGTTST